METKQPPDRRLWVARLLVGLVFLINVQCALAFILFPQVYSPSFELGGAVGDAMVRALGVLFLMWNIPYAVALVHPRKYRISLYEAIAMQAIGLAGETLILVGLPPEYAVARSGILRFIIFDGAGLLFLLMGAWISREN